MRVLVVYCHPRADSYCASLRDAAVAGLESAGNEVDMIDLYAERFDPVLPADQRGHYFDEAQNHAGLERQIAALRAADALVLVYPTWWFGMPALLKGWFDRAWVPGVAFRLGGRQVLEPMLTNIRRIAVVTTYGSPRWLLWWVGWPDWRVVKKGFLVLCAKDCRVSWIGLPGMDKASPDALRAFLSRVQDTFTRWR